MKNLTLHSLRDIPFYIILFVCLLNINANISAASAPGASLPPIIDSPCEDITFCDFSDEDDQPGNADLSESCDGFAELILLAHDANSPGNALEYSWHIYDPGDMVTPLYTGSGDIASDEYPYGTYLIKWQVEDLDGNISSCEYSFTINDLVELRKMILHINDNFPNNTSWRFVPEDYVFPDPTNPWSTEFPETINISNFPMLPYNANFVAVHTGDVNGSSAANPLTGNDERNFKDALVLNTNAQHVKKGEMVPLAINAKDFNLQGYQFTLDFDKNALEYAGIIPGALPVSDDHIGVFDGALTTSWNGDVDLAGDATLFSLTFMAKADIELSKVVSINSRITPAEAYSKTGDLMDIILAFDNGDMSSGSEFELFQNEPNPFSDVTTIGFNLPAGGLAKVTVYDAVGRVLHRIERQFAKGYNAVSIRRADLQASGVLYYELSDATESATKKLVVLE